MSRTDDIVDALKQQTDVLITIASALVKLVEVQPNVHVRCDHVWADEVDEFGDRRCTKCSQRSYFG